jgi:hypothetical protein
VIALVGDHLARPFRADVLDDLVVVAVRHDGGDAFPGSTSINRRVRDMVEWSGTLSSSAMRTNLP